MGNLSKANFFDAGANPPAQRTVKLSNGERRLERYPNGYVERWVDKAGNVCMEQIVAPGLPRSTEAKDRARSAILRRPGKWIEHKACPLRAGTLSPEDFPASMRTLCATGTYGPGNACVHVEHVISTRQEEHAEARRLRHEVMNADKIRREKMELEAAEQQKQLNANLSKIVEQATAAKGRKGSE